MKFNYLKSELDQLLNEAVKQIQFKNFLVLFKDGVLKENDGMTLCWGFKKKRNNEGIKQLGVGYRNKPNGGVHKIMWM